MCILSTYNLFPVLVFCVFAGQSSPDHWLYDQPHQSHDNSSQSSLISAFSDDCPPDLSKLTRLADVTYDNGTEKGTARVGRSASEEVMGTQEQRKNGKYLVINPPKKRGG